MHKNPSLHVGALFRSLNTDLDIEILQALMHWWIEHFGKSECDAKAFEK